MLFDENNESSNHNGNGNDNNSVDRHNPKVASINCCCVFHGSYDNELRESKAHMLPRAM